jgi:arylmalonate decarboxylase
MTTIGLIVPPADGAIPPEPPTLYPEIRFIARGMGLPRLTMEGYDSVIDHTAGLARELAEDGAEAISLMGTSLSFYRGPDGNQKVLHAMQEMTGLPVTTMTDSVLCALRVLNATRIAVATAYTDEVNSRLRDYLAKEEIEVCSLVSLDLEEIEDIQSTSVEKLIVVGQEAVTKADAPEALFISCGGLRTLPTIVPLENMTGIPVVSSATAGAWGVVRLTEHDGSSYGFGRLFEL